MVADPLEFAVNTLGTIALEGSSVICGVLAIYKESAR